MWSRKRRHPMDEQDRLEEIKQRLAQIAVEVIELTEAIKQLLRELENVQLPPAHRR
jgi:hypothetical protein